MDVYILNPINHWSRNAHPSSNSLVLPAFQSHRQNQCWWPEKSLSKEMLVMGGGKPSTHVVKGQLNIGSALTPSLQKFCKYVNVCMGWQESDTRLATKPPPPAPCLLSDFSRVWPCVTLWTVAHQALPSIGFSWQEYWVGCSALLQGIFPNQGLNPRLLPISYITDGFLIIYNR